MQDNIIKGNNHKKRGGGSGVGVNEPGFWNDTFSDMDFSNITKELLKPGEIDELMMKTWFEDTELPDLRTVVLCLSRYEKFSQTRHIKMTKYLLGGAVSVKGRSRLEFLMMKTNIIASRPLEMLLGGARTANDKPQQRKGPAKQENNNQAGDEE